MPLEPGAPFGPFVIVRRIADGPYGAVYEAYQPALARQLALKVLPRLTSKDAERRFGREAQILASLDHDAIVPIYSIGVDEGRPWMSLRLMPGGTLADRLRDRGPLTPRAAAAVVRAVARALDHAHRRAVVHRDVKSGNVLFDETGAAFLADFGVARLLDGERHESSGSATGSAQATAPEVGRGTDPSPRSDVYSLGVVAYEMLAGRVPFDGPTDAAIVIAHLTAPVPVPENVPKGILAPVLRCLEKMPADRWPSAGSFADAFEDAVLRCTTETAELPAVPPPREPAPDMPPLVDLRALVPPSPPTHAHEAGRGRLLVAEPRLGLALVGSQVDADLTATALFVRRAASGEEVTWPIGIVPAVGRTGNVLRAVLAAHFAACGPDPSLAVALAGEDALAVATSAGALAFRRRPSGELAAIEVAAAFQLGRGSAALPLSGTEFPLERGTAILLCSATAAAAFPASELRSLGLGLSGAMAGGPASSGIETLHGLGPNEGGRLHRRWMTDSRAVVVMLDYES